MVSSFSQRETRLTFFVWTLFSLFIVDPMTFNNTKSSFVIFSFVFYEEKINGSRQIFPFLIEMPSLRHLVMAKFRLEVLTTDVWFREGGGGGGGEYIEYIHDIPSVKSNETRRKRVKRAQISPKPHKKKTRTPRSRYKPSLFWHIEWGPPLVVPVAL